MDPITITFLIFALGFSAKEANLRRSDDWKEAQATRQSQIHAARPELKGDPVATKKAMRRGRAGYAAYQLRHGFPDLVNGFMGGYRDAADRHKEWIDKCEQEGRPATVREAWKAGRTKAEEKHETKIDPENRSEDKWPYGGWKGVKAKVTKAVKDVKEARAKKNGDPDESPEPIKPFIVDPVDEVIPTPRRSDPLDDDSWLNNSNTGGTTTMTQPTNAPQAVEGGINDYREHLLATIRFYTDQIDIQSGVVQSLKNMVANHEATHASLSAAGVGSIATGGVFDLMQAAQNSLSAAETAVATAEQGRATAEMLLRDLDTTHAPVQETVVAAGDQAATSTDWYKD
jgi:hypothetical protein